MFFLKVCFFLGGKIQDKGKVVVTTKLKSETRLNNIKTEIKQPIIGIGKSATPKIEVFVPPKKDIVKITIRGEGFEMLTPKGESLKIIVYKAPIVRIKPTFWVGAMGTLSIQSWNQLSTGWGLYLKCQPLEIYRFGFGGFISNQGYGFTIGYMVKRFSLDGLYEWRTQKLWGGVSLKL
jgi:hypothetical protein